MKNHTRNGYSSIGLWRFIDSCISKLRTMHRRHEIAEARRQEIEAQSQRIRRDRSAGAFDERMTTRRKGPQRMTYLAEFRQPLKHLNPMGAKIAAPVTIELFAEGSRPKKWKARFLGAGRGAKPGQTIKWTDGGEMNYPEASGGPRALQTAIATLFEEQLTPWREILTEEEQHERDHPEPPLNKKPIQTPRRQATAPEG